MKITKTKFLGLYIIEPELRSDDRGYFTRIYCIDELRKAGIKFNIIQTNQSLSIKPGTIRGLHMQKRPYSEDKFIQCLAGEVYDVSIDLRKDSRTYGKYFSYRISSENKTILMVPKGFAHGYQSLVKNSVVQYSVTAKYQPGSEIGIRWNDPSFHIKWPIKKGILSPKDESWPDYQL